MQDTLFIPLLDELAHDGFFYGGLCSIEFDPDLLWYETSLAIAVLALERREKVEYHVFEHFPREASEGLSSLEKGNASEGKGLLAVDSYAQTMEYEDEKRASLQSLFE